MKRSDPIERTLRLVTTLALLLAVAALLAVVFNIWLGARPIGQIAVIVAFAAWLAFKLRRLRDDKADQRGSADDGPSSP